jgi:type IV pilus assembly protein PilX
MAIAAKPAAFKAAPRDLRRGQRGVVLIIALVMLITITFAGLALFRQVGLGAVIVGNLAFKQGATSAADRGVEQARAWLTTPNVATVTVLQGQGVASINGYFPASCYTSGGDWGTAGTDSSCPNRDEVATPSFNPLTYNWTAANASTVAAGPDTDVNGLDSAGNTVRYVVHRLCTMDGSINEVREFASGVQAIQSCVLASGGRQCLDQGLQFAANCFAQSVQPYYRVTTRVQGPRNTLSYVEVVLF